MYELYNSVTRNKELAGSVPALKRQLVSVRLCINLGKETPKKETMDLNNGLLGRETAKYR